jgi:hypothetical protein
MKSTSHTERKVQLGICSQLAWSYGIRDGRIQAQCIDLEGQILDVANVILREPNPYEPAGESLRMN